MKVNKQKWLKNSLQKKLRTRRLPKLKKMKPTKKKKTTGPIKQLWL
jgi:hypothetical protein